MKGNVLAHVRRVQTSPEGRALVHAVEDTGLEHKLEVPVEAVRGVSSEQGYVLMIAWSLYPLPRIAEPPPPATEAPAPVSPTRSPTATDEAFMALMARGRRTSPEPATASSPEPAAPASTPASPASSGTPASAAAPVRPEQQLAALLGLHTSRAPT